MMLKKEAMEKSKVKVYDLIIIGAGAAGLFAGASLPCLNKTDVSLDKDTKLKVLMLEKNSKPGRKLLTTGGGQCNLTNTNNIKNFINHYGLNGRKIRSILYKFSNLSLMDFFEKKGLALTVQDSKRVYPQSLRSQDVLNILLKACETKGVEIRYSSTVTNIIQRNDLFFLTGKLNCKSHENKTHIDKAKVNNQQFWAKKVLVTSGGSSFPSTGSDGNLFPVLENLGLKIITPKPALTPIYVENYPYRPLSGISIRDVKLTIDNTDNGKINNTNRNNNNSQVLQEDLLFTHDCLSGPLALNASRYANPGLKLSINYLPQVSKEKLVEEFYSKNQSSKLQLTTCLFNTLNEFKAFPKSFGDLFCIRADIDPRNKASQISKSNLSKLFDLIIHDNFIISGTKGFKTAMATGGGISLDEINLNTMESTSYPGLFFAGEVLDVDGDSGGYNLQFAFSSAHLAASVISLTI